MSLIGKAEEGLELAVLLPDGRAPLVLYELGLNRNGKSIRGHELGLQHVVIPDGQPPVVLVRQWGQCCRPQVTRPVRIYSDHPPFAKEALVFKRPGADG